MISWFGIIWATQFSLWDSTPGPTDTDLWFKPTVPQRSGCVTWSCYKGQRGMRTIQLPILTCHPALASIVLRSEKFSTDLFPSEICGKGRWQ